MGTAWVGCRMMQWMLRSMCMKFQVNTSYGKDVIGEWKVWRTDGRTDDLHPYIPFSLRDGIKHSNYFSLVTCVIFGLLKHSAQFRCAQKITRKFCAQKMFWNVRHNLLRATKSTDQCFNAQTNITKVLRAKNVLKRLAQSIARKKLVFKVLRATNIFCAQRKFWNVWPISLRAKVCFHIFCA